jgi:hypothetical protein
MLPRLGICGKYPPAETAAPKNRVLRTIGNFPRGTPVRELHKAFNIPIIYYYIQNYADNKHEL